MCSQQVQWVSTGSGRTLHLIDSRSRNTAAMASIDLDTGVKTVLAESELADVSDAMIHPLDQCH